jgi:hypothetical protein
MAVSNHKGQLPIRPLRHCDPPYNVKVDGLISGKGCHRHREFVQGAGELSDDRTLAYYTTRFWY